MNKIVALTLFFLFSQNLTAAVFTQAHQVTLGKQEAPITIIEYTSLTCHHCADYHLYVLPLIKQKYVQTGQLKYIIRPLPMDKDALMAFKLIHALPAEKRDEAMTKMFSAQKHWMGKPAEVAGRMIGLAPEQCKKAVADKELENALLASTYNAKKHFEIDATPSFLMNGEKIEGAPTLDEFEVSFTNLQKEIGRPGPTVE